ncbi:myelin-oligodendrocyte glycoprotein-like [Perca flavescens]|uniref:myelin-oligodendrocyte glycoprotein-like n=1 Tax=Perca flavescens TaxID=8167 RepID=UPI00106E5634|nr:myelin-oligodendrocyte glycoprotein-like [Perca flavescens]
MHACIPGNLFTTTQRTKTSFNHLLIMTVTRLVALLIILPIAAGEHRLTCPQTIEAAEGDDVTIKCGLDPPVDLSDYTLDVARLDLGDDDGDVYVYRNGKDQQDGQMAQYRGRTTLNHEDLRRGTFTLKISSVNLSDSGPYKVYIPKLPASSVVNITGVPKDQANRTKRNDPSTPGPPVGEVTKSDHRGGSAKEESVGIIVLASVSGVVVVVGVGVVFLLLVKHGVIHICKKTTEAATRSNNLSVNYLRTPTTEEDGDHPALQDTV